MKKFMLTLIALFASICNLQICIAAPTPPSPPFPSGNISDCPDGNLQVAQLNNRNSGFITVKKNGDYNYLVPENSLNAFDLSYKFCRPAIEIPIQLTKDDQVIIFNDTYIERMTDKNFNPELPQSLKTRTALTNLSDLKKFNLINIDGKITDEKIPTLQEFILDYIKKKPGTLVYVKSNDPKALLLGVSTLDKIINSTTNKEIANKFIFKVGVEQFVLPKLLTIAFKNNGIVNYNLMNFNPVLTRDTFNKLNEGNDLTARGVMEFWAENSELKTPVYDVEMNKDDQNTGNNSISAISALLSTTYKKRLGAFVNVPDYPIWRLRLSSGYTVNNTANDKKPINVAEASYNEDGTCCYKINQANDLKFLLTRTGANVLTSLDTDSLESYPETNVLLNKTARPKSIYPPYQMKSSLSWMLGFYKKPNGSSIILRAITDTASNDWKNGVCLYSNQSYPGVAYSCNDEIMQGWGFNKQLVVRMADEDSMYIQDPSTNLCLTGSTEGDHNITFWGVCQEKSKWIRHGNKTFENKVFKNTYLSFYVDGEWKDSRYGLVNNANKFNYKNWEMVSSANRWSIYDF
ncbi:hypothetical protein GRY85_003880 [Salmonella enterica]|nr:hypothetical protein [Salmonella enterica]